MSDEIQWRDNESLSNFKRRRAKAKRLQLIRDGLVEGPDPEIKKAARARHKQRQLDYMEQVRQRLKEQDEASKAEWEARFGKDK